MIGTFEFKVEVTHGSILEDAERQLILHVMHLCGGHQASAADALGMGLRTLGIKLSQMRTNGIVVPRYVEHGNGNRTSNNTGGGRPRRPPHNQHAELQQIIRRLLKMACGDPRPCRECGRPVYWMKMLDSGRMNLLTDEGISHFADCPGAAKFRKGKG